MGRPLRLLVLVFALAGALGGGPLHAQSAGTLPPLDPVYEDLAFLEAHGLAPRGATSIRPLSYARVGWILRDARAWWMSRSGPPSPAHADVEAVLGRLEGRFLRGGRGETQLEFEAGGGRSPGHTVPDNRLADVDLVVNPMWARRGGRAYADRWNAATAARHSQQIGDRVAIGVAGRASGGDWSGVESRRGGAVLEAAYARVGMGRLALQIGRDAWWSGRPGESAPLLGGDTPPVDLIRLSTDRPLGLRLLGDVEFSLVAADLGGGQNYPHAKLFGATLSTRPVEALEVGLTLVNKQGGEGAPAATLGARLRDLSFLFSTHDPGVPGFSEKLFGMDAHLRIPSTGGGRLYAALAVTDFDTGRIRDILETESAITLGVELARLGASERHGIEFEYEWTGGMMYRHHQFTSGFAVDGFSQGSGIGPDGRGLTGRYSYRAPAQGWTLFLEGRGESRSIDPHDARPNPRDVFRSGSLPHEERLLGRLGAELRLGEGTRLELSGALERVENFDYQADDRRTNSGFLVRFWRAF